jgi:hypothetical protein
MVPLFARPFDVALNFLAVGGPLHSGCGMRPIMFRRPVPALAHSHMPRRDGDCGDKLLAAWTSPALSTTVPSSLSLRGGRIPSELWRCSPWAGRDCVFVSSMMRDCSVDCLFLSRGVTFFHFSLSFAASRFGGRVAIAISCDVPTVGITGLVSRRRRGPTLIPS